MSSHSVRGRHSSGQTERGGGRLLLVGLAMAFVLVAVAVLKVVGLPIA